MDISGQQERKYYYRPMKHYGGQVYKCAGHGAEDPKHREFYEPWFSYCLDGDPSFEAGVVVLDGYRGNLVTKHGEDWVEYK